MRHMSAWHPQANVETPCAIAQRVILADIWLSSNLLCWPEVVTIIYLDGHATTPLAPEAADAMRLAWMEPGNAGSPHLAGAKAAEIVEAGRAAVADLIGAAPSEVTFTSGATEANNLVIQGVVRTARAAGIERHRLVVAATEHKSILACAEALTRDGIEVVIAPVQGDGLIDLATLSALVDDRTLLVSVGAANGEIGVLQPIAEVSAIAHRVGSFMHSDLAQFAGKAPCDVVALDLDYGSLSSHKMYGPVGVGALFVSAAALPPSALMYGGGQEHGLRPGTIPAPLIAGFGAAARTSATLLDADKTRAKALAKSFVCALSERQVAWRLNGHQSLRLPGSLSLQIIGIDAESIVERLSAKVAISTGSACLSGQIDTSHVLRALGLSRSEQLCTIRILFGRYNTQSDVLHAADAIAAAARQESLAHWTPRPVVSGHA